MPEQVNNQKIVFKNDFASIKLANNKLTIPKSSKDAFVVSPFSVDQYGKIGGLIGLSDSLSATIGNWERELEHASFDSNLGQIDNKNGEAFMVKKISWQSVLPVKASLPVIVTKGDKFAKYVDTLDELNATLDKASHIELQVGAYLRKTEYASFGAGIYFRLEEIEETQ